MLVPDLIAEHAAEAAFLWAQRARLVVSPLHDLAALVEQDGRLAAHLDGLLLAGTQGWRATDEALAAYGRAEDAFPATWLAGITGDGGRLPAIIAALTDDPRLVPGIAGALAWLPVPARSGAADLLWRSGSPAARCAVIDGLAQLGVDPGLRLDGALDDPDEPLRRCALLAVGRCGRRDLLARVALARGDDAAPTSRAAAWTQALLGDQDGVAALQRMAVADLTEASTVVAVRRCDAEALLDLIARRLPPATALAWAERHFGATRPAVVVAEAVGDPLAVPWLLDCCRQPALARRAGSAIARMCGIDLVALGCSVPTSDGCPPPDFDDDAEVVADPDHHLPFPDAGRLASWWERQGGAYPPGRRHCAGRLAGPAPWRERLRRAAQDERQAVARDLLLVDGRLFPVEAPGIWQRHVLESSA